MDPKHGRFVFLPYSPAEVLRDVRLEHFPHLADRVVTIHFEGGKVPLARIVHGASRFARITVHDSLNRPDTPIEVFICILKHELLHLEVPARNGDSHPPEFWERARALIPENAECGRWLAANIPALCESWDGTTMVRPRSVRRRPAKPANRFSMA